MLYKIENEKQESKKQQAQFNKWKAFNESSFAALKQNVDLSDADLFPIYASAVVLDRWPALNNTAIVKARKDFTDNYADVNDAQTFYDDLVVSWNSFSNKVVSLNTDATTGLPITDLNDLALKFIHRYDTNSSRWFLSVQLCAIGQLMAGGTPAPEIYNLYSLSNIATYFHINIDGTLGDYKDGDLDGADDSRYSQAYFDNVLYMGSALQLGTNTQNVTIPWNEFVEMFNDNSNASRPDASAFTIAFASISFRCTDKDDSATSYPHCILSYLAYNGVDCLDDSGYVIGNFYNKAGDFNTMCPKRCDTIAYPIGYFPGR